MPHESWSFVAMEYYALILNRTYLLTVNDAHLEGKVCRGLTSIEAGVGLTRMATSQMAVQGNLYDPQSYVNRKLIARPNRANFEISLNSIKSVEYTAQKKWGMGYYPHDGRVFVNANGHRREFIILGHQSGEKIAARLAMEVENASRK